ncbi:nuclear transport factor 2 family protein [Chryseobacterium shandongense]|uniref:nuclear transport factor 2 family protein n=1 Tax=Chryseobacterium shandongense TaxID=1493872 RepID=UPI0013DDE372|nr:nuclear transport factor 2 family protein [Chryseobacterium shandongense]
MAEGNYEDFIGYCAEDIKWINVGGIIFNGKTEILKYISSSYNDISFTTEDHITEKDIVVEFGEIIFEKKSEAKKGSYCDIWKFKNGLIIQVKSFII